MLSVEQNTALTQTGKGTPMGDLLRRYWHPIAPLAELDEKPTKAVRLLGEDLVLYRDQGGQLGLIDLYCPHRRVDMSYGIPEPHGLRCMYHGWLFDETGACTEQPFEDTVHPDGRFKDKVKIVGYPVQESGGLVFAYLGPDPVPLLPAWEPLRWDEAVRDIAISELPCNWLQCQENSLDPVHVEWMHSYYAAYLDSPDIPPRNRLAIPRHEKISFDLFDHGIIKRRVLEGYSEEDDDWKLGHPILFPNILLVGSESLATLQFRVPVDDENTYHISLYSWKAAPGAKAPVQDVVPYRYVELTNHDQRYNVDYIFNQDYMGWITQGKIADRSRERLGESDLGLILYRKLLKEQMELNADGGEPMNVIRDEEANQKLSAPLEAIKFGKVMRNTYFPAERGWSADKDKIEGVLGTWKSHEGETATGVA